MAASALAPILSTAFAPAAGAAAGAGAFAGIGWKLVGGILAGIGQAKLQEAKMDKEEEQKIAEEKRRQATYEGSGDAVRFWDAPEDVNNMEQGPNYERVNPQSSMRLGATPSKVGDKYRMPAPQKAARFKYDPESQRIIPA